MKTLKSSYRGNPLLHFIFFSPQGLDKLDTRVCCQDFFFFFSTFHLQNMWRALKIPTKECVLDFLEENSATKFRLK